MKELLIDAIIIITGFVAGALTLASMIKHGGKSADEDDDDNDDDNDDDEDDEDDKDDKDDKDDEEEVDKGKSDEDDSDEDLPNTLVDMLIDHYINGDTETTVCGDMLTQCCYYVTDDNLCPVYKPDGTIYTIEELKPLLETAYNCKIDMEENAKFGLFDNNED